MNKMLALLLIIAIHKMAAAQNVGIGTITPNPSAILDVQSSNKGALIPRATSAQRKAIVDPEPGLMVYDTDKRTIFIFEGTAWGQLVYKGSEQAEPIMRNASDGRAGDQLGTNVALDGETAIAGSPNKSIGFFAEQGAAYIFNKVNGTWIQQAKLVAADGAAFDHFGFSVSISGNYAVVGAYSKNKPGGTKQGAAYVFVRSNGLWTQQAKLTAPDGATDDNFGYSVAIKDNDIIVGAPSDDVDGNASQGSVYFYARQSVFWLLLTKLSSPDNGATRRVGYCVSIDGSYAVAGAPGNTAAYIYFRGAAGWSASATIIKDLFTFGSSVSISGTSVVVGAPAAPFAGHAAVFARNLIGNWPEQATLTLPISQSGILLGISVSISGDNAVVGASRYSENDIKQGKAFVFTRNGTSWILKRNISDALPEEWAYFGYSVSLDGYNMIISSPSSEAGKGRLHFLNIE